MPVVYRINELADLPDNHLYAVVAFWLTAAAEAAGERPHAVEDFVVDVPDLLPVVNDAGEWQMRNGRWAEPWVEVDGEWMIDRPDRFRMTPADPMDWLDDAIEMRARKIHGDPLRWRNGRPSARLAASKSERTLLSLRERDAIGVTRPTRTGGPR